MTPIEKGEFLMLFAVLQQITHLRATKKERKIIERMEEILLKALNEGKNERTKG